MHFEFHAFLSFLIGVPVLIGWIRFRKTGPGFLPFLLLLTAGLLNEIISYFLIREWRTNVVSFNLYSLVETALILWQFYRWEAFRSRRRYLTLQVVLALVWCAETLLVGSIFSFNSYQLVATDAVVIAFAIHVTTREMFTRPGSLLRNATFLICAGLGIFHTYSILVELFWLQGLDEDRFFRGQVLSILPYVNFFANLLFTLAALWAPIHYRFFRSSFSSMSSLAD
ncbi:MAG TPA: hypothetical protein VGN63_16960 [Flavisolibacter sp.]|jgi:hypothetical protein|nr:hypothetical protein [Flavisolibacter sp.]